MEIGYLSTIAIRTTSRTIPMLTSKTASRAASCAMIPLSALGITFDTIVGMVGAVGAILTAGTNKNIWSIASSLEYSHCILNIPYLNLLRTINPQAKVECLPDGITYSIIVKPLKDYLRTLRSPDNNFLNRKITSRIGYSLLSIVTIVIRAVDGLIGLVAAILSLVTLGTNTDINTFAFAGLSSTGIIYDLFYCAVKFINPHAGVFPKH